MKDTPRTDNCLTEILDAFGYVHQGNCPQRWVNHARELERELNAANERIRLLIAERDTARRQADQTYKLRKEFAELLGTDDVERGVAVVREMKERIKRLEEAGDEMYRWITVKRLCSIDCTEAWNKAKEAKP